MGDPTSEVGYTFATPRRADHEVHKKTCGGIGEKTKYERITHRVALCKQDCFVDFCLSV
jgi:hypothetical protein